MTKYTTEENNKIYGVCSSVISVVWMWVRGAGTIGCWVLSGVKRTQKVQRGLTPIAADWRVTRWEWKVGERRTQSIFYPVGGIGTGVPIRSCHSQVPLLSRGRKPLWTRQGRQAMQLKITPTQTHTRTHPWWHSHCGLIIADHPLKTTKKE